MLKMDDHKYQQSTNVLTFNPRVNRLLHTRVVRCHIGLVCYNSANVSEPGIFIRKLSINYVIVST